MMIDKSPVYIIGAGLFGAVARDLLHRHGVPCFTIDAQLPLAGSPAAGCLTKPSWLQSLAGWREGIELLVGLYGSREIIARCGFATTQLLHFAPSKILQAPHIIGEVLHIDPDAGEVLLSDGRAFSGRVLVAAGVWSKALLADRMPEVELIGLVGRSLWIDAQLQGDEALLKVWAPFKQSVAFNITSGQIWFGDGTAVKLSSWSTRYAERVVEHASQLGVPLPNFTGTTGQRPYVKGKKGYFKQVGARCWVSTGGAKNGVVLAATQSLQFLEALRQ